MHTANQLTRENNQKAGKTWVWTYDNAGNILSRKEYAYTTGTLGAVLDTVSYGYNDPAWGDLLTGYDGKTISYDAIGNPLSDGTWTYAWEHGRELASMSDGSTTWNYEYNADGLRTKRTNGTNTYYYYYAGGQLLNMRRNYSFFRFAYDASGAPMTVIYGGETYFYVTNIQGDVIAILDDTGATVVEYTYDAWGNVLTTTGSMASTLGKDNPLRYRGYVYDTETGLYYLQSRYYDPEMGRFINADAYTSTGQGSLGNNMFAYCTNNPIGFSDGSGLSPQKTTAPFVVVIILDDGCGSGGAGGGGVDPALLTIAALVQLWKALDRLPTKNDTDSESDAIFYQVHVDNGQWIKDSTPMTFDQAYDWVISTAITHAFGYRASWGLYTKNEKDALEMALALGGAEPVWDVAQAGQYRHYHVYGRNLFSKYKHFHVWYGSPKQ